MHMACTVCMTCNVFIIHANFHACWYHTQDPHASLPWFTWNMHHMQAHMHHMQSLFSNPRGSERCRCYTCSYASWSCSSSDHVLNVLHVLHVWELHMDMHSQREHLYIDLQLHAACTDGSMDITSMGIRYA